jgi:hypothetical protein
MARGRAVCFLLKDGTELQQFIFYEKRNRFATYLGTGGSAERSSRVHV